MEFQDLIFLCLENDFWNSERTGNQLDRMNIFLDKITEKNCYY